MTGSCHSGESWHSDYRWNGNGSTSCSSSCWLLSSHLGHGQLSVVSVGSHSSVDSKLALAKEVFEVVEHPDSHWVLHVNTLHTGEIASSLSHTLTDSHDAVVKESPGVAIGSVGITEAWGERKEREEGELSFRCLLTT